jgi:hypothetical protein
LPAKGYRSCWVAEEGEEGHLHVHEGQRAEDVTFSMAAVSLAQRSPLLIFKNVILMTASPYFPLMVCS